MSGKDYIYGCRITKVFVDGKWIPIDSSKLSGNWTKEFDIPSGYGPTFKVKARVIGNTFTIIRSSSSIMKIRFETICGVSGMFHSNEKWNPHVFSF